MSDERAAGRFEGRISLGNLITIGTGIVALAAMWGSLQGDFRALAQRVDRGEIRDDKTAEALESIKGAITEMRAEQRATRAEAERIVRQVDRLVERFESLMRASPHPLPKTGNP